MYCCYVVAVLATSRLRTFVCIHQRRLTPYRRCLEYICLVFVCCLALLCNFVVASFALRWCIVLLNQYRSVDTNHRSLFENFRPVLNWDLFHLFDLRTVVTAPKTFGVFAACVGRLVFVIAGYSHAAILCCSEIGFSCSAAYQRSPTPIVCG